jgi:hypothetical protein
MEGDKARCNGLNEYLGPKKCTMYDLHNIQTRILGHGNLTLAKDILEKSFWFGITEYFDVSMCLLAYQLGQFNRALCDCSKKPKVVVDPKNVSIKLFFTT